jgi:hypothetical protein
MLGNNKIGLFYYAFAFFYYFIRGAILVRDSVTQSIASDINYETFSAWHFNSVADGWMQNSWSGGR